MISDERLREAAREAEEKLLASLPKPEDCEATFSPEYKRKMKKLARRTDHPVIYWVHKAVACILLTILIGGGGILTFSTEARAAFVGWVREVYETWFVYNYEGVDREFPEDNVFYPAWIPDGYYELKRSISDDKVSIIYENEEGYLLSFTYTRNRESVSVYSENQGTDVQTVTIGNTLADLYLDQREGNTNTLIWDDEEKGVIFVISAHCSGGELVEIAENITNE